MTQPFDPDLFPNPVMPNPEMYPIPNADPGIYPDMPNSPDIYPQHQPSFDPDLLPPNPNS